MALQQSWMTIGSGAGGFTKASQSFTTGVTYTLEQVSLRLMKIPTRPVTTATIGLYAASETTGLPEGEELLSIGNISSNDLTTSLAWVAFADLDYEMAAATRYAIVMTIQDYEETYEDQLDIPTIYWGGANGYADQKSGAQYWYWSDAGEGAWVHTDTWDSPLPLFDWNFYCLGTAEEDAPTKATNPTPADSATPGVDFSDYTLSWEDGGGATSYNLRLIDWDGYTGTIETGLEDTTYTFSVGSGFRRTDITSALGWRIDSVNEYGTTTGDTWTFDPRPKKADVPYPTDGAEGQSIYSDTISWWLEDTADTYKVYFEHGLLDYLGETEENSWSFGVGGGVFDILPLDRNTEYPWRVDTVNVFGTTTGDEWSFTTLDIDYPTTSWANFPGKTLGPTDAGSVVGVDYYWVGRNNMTTLRRVVALAANTLWYMEY